MISAELPVSNPLSFVYPTHLNLGEQTSEGFHQELLRGLTHKLNNMLAIIQGFSSLILMNKALDESGLENMQHIKEASLNISALSERIRAAGGCAKVSLQSLQVEDYFNVIQASFREPFLKNDVEFDLEIASHLPSIKVDPTKLKDLLLEILKNAAEAASKGGGRALMQVTGPGVASPATDNRVDILITNTGSQIAANKLEEIFKPFSGTKNSHHLGLGLTIAAMLAHQMDIRLGVNSQDHTTTFWVSVPVA
ncbi:HAMP domain-containing histidine kinase [Phragmitibacter flavus]|uniref:histidine kinase n=1 Tax=Phragmitibacter flavus TaxID=2576071 RepID=A0A5R8KHC7_9BACT|nr:HAMP domain-containing sensor histidine kinase [Phragmitibacter flavus]TLD71641.1 HAMP domain-containing histidine kinase [Phragmitibacter flavus]